MNNLDKEVKCVRRRRSKWKRKLLVLLVMVILIGVVLLRFVFVVRNVNVQGNLGAYSPEELMRASGVEFGGSIFNVDEEDIRRHINATGLFRLEGLKFDYPNTVHLQLVQRGREAMILHMGKIRVLDDTGCIVESLDDVPDMDLIYVSGLRVASYATGEALLADVGQMEAYCAVIQALNLHGADIYISELNLDDIHNLRLITRTGITVELGDAQKMQDKIAWTKSAVADLENRGETGGTLDVSSGNKADYRTRTGAQQ